MEICSRPEPGDYQWKIKSEWIYYLGKLKATSQALFNLILNSRKILKFQILISSVVPPLLQSCNMSTNVIETHFILNIKFYSKYLYLIFNKHLMLQGVPKKMLLLSSFEFLILGEVFLGVKNNSKNLGNKKI